MQKQRDMGTAASAFGSQRIFVKWGQACKVANIGYTQPYGSTILN